MRIRTEDAGLAAFGLGIIVTGLLVWMGLTMEKLPEWLLAVTTVL